MSSRHWLRTCGTVDIGHRLRDLGVHRNTLRYRLLRAGEALGVDVDDPDIAARLWLLMRERGAA
jgi:sugar diacid utilization regulator